MVIAKDMIIDSLKNLEGFLKNENYYNYLKQIKN